ncbi:hypothetical protein [Gracilibacillus phocaeensis]|uniref:hypothetical protein n=1 Tax=Gracilibacillus phocaeensis TaxID=2042304 RepID=UPI0010307232|nr:hypothetical protein [Gracilibacillus phocaeensis]
MKKIKIHPLIIVGLFISSTANGLAVYRHYHDDRQTAVVFAVLCILTLGMAVFGLIRNQKMN